MISSNRKYSSGLLQKITHFIFRLVTGKDNKRVFQHFKIFFIKKENILRFITIVFFVFAFFVPNDKYFFVLSSSFLFFIWFKTNSIFTTFFLVFVPLSVFVIGQEYFFTAVPKSIISSFQYPEGRVLSFTFSPFMALLISVIGTFCFHFFSGKIKKTSFHFNLLLVVVLFVIASASNSFYFSTYSMIYALHWFAFVCFTLLVVNHFSSFSSKQRNSLWKLFFFQVACTLLFISFISSLQLVIKAPIGLNIESVKYAPSFGEGADESTLIFRPVGLTSHANIMANEVFILTITLIAVYIRLTNNVKKSKNLDYFFIVTLLSSFFTMVISQSRSIYISLGIFSLLLYYYNKDHFKKIFLLLKPLFFSQKKVWLVIFLFVFFIVFNRAWYSQYSFTDTGGFEIRNEMNKEALGLIVKYPALGVGTAMFIPALVAENPTGIVQKFPEAVHNGFLLFITENGLVTQLFFLIFLFFFIRKVVFSGLTFNLKVVLIVGIFSQLIPMLFQPFINYLTVYTMTSLILLSEEKT